MRTILVTGASRGIGREIAKTLAKQGDKVIANYLNSEEAAKRLQEEYPTIDIYKADVSKREDVAGMIEYIVATYGKIDVVINNAGIDEFKLFTDISDDDWHKMMDTNLYSVFCVSQEAVKHMLKRKNGCIINISSVWGLVGASCEVHYSVSKAGIIGLTKSLAKELGPSNIRVNSIAPGTIDTDMNKNLGTEVINSIKEDTPLGKIGRPEDIAKCVKWLIDDEFTTGQIISVNGGWVI